MKSKVLTIVLTLVLSVPFSISIGVFFAWLGGVVFGSSVGADGQEYINNSGIVVFAALASTVVFAVWFYKFFTSYKKSKASEVKNVGE